MDRGAWQARVHEVAESQTQLSIFYCYFPLKAEMDLNKMGWQKYWIIEINLLCTDMWILKSKPAMGNLFLSLQLWARRVLFILERCILLSCDYTPLGILQLQLILGIIRHLLSDSMFLKQIGFILYGIN